MVDEKMRELAMQLGNWQTVRQAALTFLEAAHNTSTLVEVALDEGDVERSLHLLEVTKPHGLESYQWQYDYSQSPEAALKTAERAEEVYPRASIDLYISNMLNVSSPNVDDPIIKLLVVISQKFGLFMKS